MKVKIKKLHPDAVIPKYAKPGDAGLDLVAVSLDFDDFGNMEYDTGLAIQIPDGYVGLIFPRSSIHKVTQTLSNSVGVIDSGYRGSIKFKYKPTLKYGGGEVQTYEIGDKIAQIIIIPYPQIELEEVEELTQTERGASGYGSSGK